MDINTLLLLLLLAVVLVVGFRLFNNVNRHQGLPEGDTTKKLPSAEQEPLNEMVAYTAPPITNTEQQTVQEQKTLTPPPVVTSPPPIAQSSKIPPPKGAEPPVSFGKNRLWMAIKSTDAERIATILDLRNAKPAGWHEGLESRKPSEGGIYITPPIDGWTLVVGWGFMADTLTETLTIAEELVEVFSQEMGEAQYFCNHERADYHCWIKATNGEVVRAYAWLGESGENLVVKGSPTTAEPLHLINTLSEEAQNPTYYENDDIVFPDANMVFSIAEQWSINPTTLHLRKNVGDKGIFGE